MRVLLLVAAIALVVATPVEAHLAHKVKNDTVKERLRVQTLNLRHAKYVCNSGAKHHKRWACKAVKWIGRERAKTQAKLRPRVKYLSAWLCIHRHEGSWTDSGDPYWGGLQMDRQFMYTYGSDMIRKYGGFAHLWTPIDQMIVAERAHNSGRGFYPWPNTARYCGLI